MGAEARGRIGEAVDAALGLGKGTLIVSPEGGDDILLSADFACPECGLSAVAPANYYTGNVSSQDGVAITIDGLNAAKGTDFCVSGKLLDEHGEYQQVIAQGGDIVTLNLPLLDDVVGEDVTVWRSCDHSYEDCVALSNGSNFGGFLGIPSRNPFTKGVD